MQLSNRPQRKTEYKTEVMDDELLLYHPDQDTLLHFNQTASLIWQLCDGTRSASELIALLQAAYPEAAGEIEADVCAALEQFEKQGCIHIL